MNKLLIVLLAVCLVSVHAFVKRDAETPQTDGISNLQKEFETFSKTVQDKFSEAINPDQIKKGFNDIVDKLNEAVNKMKPQAEAAKQ